MALFLAVLGGAAVVEVHRAITGAGGSKDVHLLKQREENLRRQLQDIQKELENSKQQRELSEGEAAQLAAINHQLLQDKDALAQETTSLKAENEELAQRAERLIERQQLLESCAESLKLENRILIQQFDKLKLKHEGEIAAFQEQLAGLKASVGATLQQFTGGEITADQLIRFLSDMGVELRCPQEEVAELPQRLAIAASAEERVEALGNVELKVEDNWMERMKLASSSPHRAARLLLGGAAMAQEAAVLCSRPASAASQAEPRRLVTPRSLEAAEHRAPVVPALKLTSHAVADVESEDTIAAVHAPAPEPAALALEAQPKQAPKQASKSRSLLFRPAKKAVKKATAALKSQQALLEVDMPLEAGASAVPRLPFDAMCSESGMSAQGGSSLLAM